MFATLGKDWFRKNHHWGEISAQTHVEKGAHMALKELPRDGVLVATGNRTTA